MKRLRPFAMGVAVLLLLYFFDRWLFARFFHVPYWQWYLKNGSLIGLVSAIMLGIWGEAADKHRGLISAHPLVYLSSWLHFIGLPVYSLGTQIKPNTDKSRSRSVVDGVLTLILVLFFLVPAILAWYILIVPPQFLVYFICGSPVRHALTSDRMPIARLMEAGVRLDADEAYKYRLPLFRMIDVRNAGSLITKLCEPDEELSEYLQLQLPSDLRNRLEEFKDSPSPPVQLQSSLLEKLNELLKGDSLYDKNRFSGITLTEKTLKQIGKPGQPEDLIRLNRTLLEEAYPDELAPSLNEKPANAWWDASFGRKPVSTTNVLGTLFLWVLQHVLF